MVNIDGSRFLMKKNLSEMFSRSILVFQTLILMDITCMHHLEIEICWFHHVVFDDFCIHVVQRVGKPSLVNCIFDMCSLYLQSWYLAI